jgi:Exostosin family
MFITQIKTLSFNITRVNLASMTNLQIISTPDSLNAALETWFIQNELFSGAPYSLGVNSGQLGDSAIVYLELNQINIDLIRHIKSLGNKVVLYHMGGERLDKDISAYSECNLVIRNYYFQTIIETGQDSKVLWAPNGFRTGVGPRNKSVLKKSSQRQCLSAFLGWINNAASYNNERASFAGPATTCGENLYVMPSNGFAGGYNVGLYSAIMEDSIFAPCPSGNNPETIRLYDALELGCIPISLSHEFLLSKDALASIGPVPFPILGSWAELPQFLGDMKAKALSNPNEILELQLHCINWWSDFKIAIQKRISDRIEAL